MGLEICILYSSVNIRLNTLILLIIWSLSVVMSHLNDSLIQTSKLCSLSNCFDLQNICFCRKTRIWEVQIQLICALMMFKLWSLECSHVGKNILGSSSSSKTTCEMTMYFFLINDKKNSQNINWSFCRKSEYHKKWYQTW